MKKWGKNVPFYITTLKPFLLKILHIFKEKGRSKREKINLKR